MENNNVKTDDNRTWITLYDEVTRMVLGIFWAKDVAEARKMYKEETIFG